MKGWMISADGSAVNLQHVTQVLAEKRASHVDDTWYVLARPAGVALATSLESREDAVNWIRERFGDTPHLKDAAKFYGMSEEYLRSLPKHEAHCALVTTHDLACTCGTYARQHRSVSDGPAT